ncbi:MAG: ligase-associated DNA damage response endonuclease PdeM [Proteobacteria bacterium]|nr:ligase-associated DNA damage response endonuclease PdeM [Pseudomonadota bacterium]
MAIEVNGEHLMLDAAGALWWPSESTLVFADLHFEKGSSYARTGQLLPPYDTRTTLNRMARLVACHRPSRIIALGDSFHDREAAERLDDHERGALEAMAKAAEWIWIEGNHDPVLPVWLGGRVASEIAIGGLLFRHEPSASHVKGEIAGHLHPCKSVTQRGHTLRRRCFASDGRRVVLPAFGAYAGGLDVEDLALRSLFADAFRAYVLGAKRVYAVAA